MIYSLYFDGFVENFKLDNIFLVICSETAFVAPLETLNTNLNYKILDDFIGKITDSTIKFYSTVLVNNNNTTNLSHNTSNTTPILIPYGLLSIIKYLFKILFSIF
jgi:hypothetical protein